jgi:hypothetical protein
MKLHYKGRWYGKGRLQDIFAALLHDYFKPFFVNVLVQILEWK